MPAYGRRGGGTGTEKDEEGLNLGFFLYAPFQMEWHVLRTTAVWAEITGPLFCARLACNALAVQCITDGAPTVVAP